MSKYFYRIFTIIDLHFGAMQPCSSGLGMTLEASDFRSVRRLVAYSIYRQNIFSLCVLHFFRRHLQCEFILPAAPTCTGKRCGPLMARRTCGPFMAQGDHLWRATSGTPDQFRPRTIHCVTVLINTIEKVQVLVCWIGEI